jgi:hypothetical protein
MNVGNKPQNLSFGVLCAKLPPAVYNEPHAAMISAVHRAVVLETTKKYLQQSNTNYHSIQTGKTLRINSNIFSRALQFLKIPKSAIRKVDKVVINLNSKEKEQALASLIKQEISKIGGWFAAKKNQTRIKVL